jgi:hypothetical protein
LRQPPGEAQANCRPLRQVGPEGDVALAEDRALAAYARRAFDAAEQQ